MGKLARDITLSDVAAAIREFKDSSLSYSALAAFRDEFDDFQSMIMSMVGTPLKAAQAADMTDASKIYVYVGDETGYVNGDWYYYDPQTSAWVDGGIYNAVAINAATLAEIKEYIG